MTDVEEPYIYGTPEIYSKLGEVVGDSLVIWEREVRDS